MSDAESTITTSKLPIIAGSIAAGLLLLTVVGFLIYSAVCPCERTPGGFLLGQTVDEEISDWGFANDVELCQLQIYAGLRPHSINLNCMATPTGEMYLSCSVCTSKYWAGKVGADETASMRLNGFVYPVKLNRITDPTTMDRAWAARVAKLQVVGKPPLNPAPAPDAQRPDHWWTFQVESTI